MGFHLFRGLLMSWGFPKFPFRGGGVTFLVTLLGGLGGGGGVLVRVVGAGALDGLRGACGDVRTGGGLGAGAGGLGAGVGGL